MWTHPVGTRCSPWRRAVLAISTSPNGQRGTTVNNGLPHAGISLVMKGSAVRIRASASEKALQERQFLTSMILWSQSCSQAKPQPGRPDRTDHSLVNTTRCGSARHTKHEPTRRVAQAAPGNRDRLPAQIIDPTLAQLHARDACRSPTKGDGAARSQTRKSADPVVSSGEVVEKLPRHLELGGFVTLREPLVDVFE